MKLFFRSVFLFGHISFCVLFSGGCLALESVHFLIPGGAGGGWDTTARQAGKALLRESLAERVTYQNYSGGGGARALLSLIDHPDQHTNTLMVQSTPLIYRNLNGMVKYGFRDIQPIAIMISEYQVVAVLTSSRYQTLRQLLERVSAEPFKHPIIGGSVVGSLDHISVAMIAEKANLQPTDIRYVPSDGGKDALDRLRNGLGVALITGFGEIVQEYARGSVRVLGITSPYRLSHYPNIPTMIEQDLDVVFSNWRGFFANKKLDELKKKEFKRALRALDASRSWRDIREAYAWDRNYLEGEEALNFLIDQEATIKDTLTTMGY